MPSTIAVAHYPEGAGHATRMLAIANALEERGADVLMAGGGAGTEFVSLNGYDEFEPTTVDYIDTYQNGSIGQVVTRSLPASVHRVTDYVAWLEETDPDALVTDDMFAAMAASRTDVPLYVLKHDMPGLYPDLLERAGATFHAKFQLSVAREFFYPVVCPPSEIDLPDATRIPPVALDGDGSEIDVADVLLVPSYYSEFDEVAARLERRGYDVLNVGGDDWEPVASLLPYIRGADVVVCSGYSTVMDAAVAGTPCVIHPVTSEQVAVAEWIDRTDAAGFTVAEDRHEILDAVASPPDPPSYGNGADVVAERVMDDLERTSDVEPTPVGDRVTTARHPFFGKADRAVAASATASTLAVGVAQQVAARNAYLQVERTLPTYGGNVNRLFLIAGVALVLLSALGAALDAGVIPSILLAGGPVLGWATNHWMAPISPHYGFMFPLEMAVLYGGAFGIVGYLLGINVRRLVRPLRTPTARSGAGVLGRMR